MYIMYIIDYVIYVCIIYYISCVLYLNLFNLILYIYIYIYLLAIIYIYILIILEEYYVYKLRCYTGSHSLSCQRTNS